MTRRQLIEPKPAVGVSAHGLHVEQLNGTISRLVSRVVFANGKCKLGRNLLAGRRIKPAFDAAQASVKGDGHRLGRIPEHPWGAIPAVREFRLDLRACRDAPKRERPICGGRRCQRHGQRRRQTKIVVRQALRVLPGEDRRHDVGAGDRFSGRVNDAPASLAQLHDSDCAGRLSYPADGSHPAESAAGVACGQAEGVREPLERTCCLQVFPHSRQGKRTLAVGVGLGDGDRLLPRAADHPDLG